MPFLIRWPGHTQAGTCCDACLNTVDIMPTLLDMMGLPIPDGVEGMSIARRVQGLPGPEPDFAWMMCTGATADFQDGCEWRAIRDKRYTYAIFQSDKSELLFDNIKDPYQMHNLIDRKEYAQIAAEFRRMLKGQLEKYKDVFPPCSYYKGRWVDENRLIQKTATLHTDLEL